MKTRIALVAVLLGIVAGCTVPRTQIGAYYIPETNKVARLSVQPTGSLGENSQNSSNVDLTNFYVEVCDVVDGQATNCHMTMVLQNITNVQFGWR